MPASIGNIYLIKSPLNLYKLGRATDLGARLQNLSTGSPVTLDVLYSKETTNVVQVEARLHQYFSQRRHHGEWFSFDARELDWVIETIDSYCSMDDSYRNRSEHQVLRAS